MRLAALVRGSAWPGRFNLAVAEIHPWHKAHQALFIERRHPGDAGQATSPVRPPADRCQVCDPHGLLCMTAQAGERFLKAHEGATADEQNTPNGKLQPFHRMTDLFLPELEQGLLCVRSFGP